MGFLIDSTVFIDHFRGNIPQVTNWLALHSRISQLTTSAIVVAELLQGTRSPASERVVRDTLKGWQIVPVGGADAFLAGELLIRYRKQGQTLHLADTLIGASALNRGFTLVTSNVKDFPFISTLDPRQINDL